MRRLAFEGWGGLTALAVTLALLLGACALPVAPETPRERLAVLEISVQEAGRAAQDLVATGALHGPAAQHLADLFVAVKTALRAARTGVDGPNAIVLLDALNRALVELAQRLQEVEA